MLRLIGLDGYAGVGKDSICEGLVRSYGFVRVPFAKHLKEVCSIVSGLPLHYFEIRALKDNDLVTPFTLEGKHLLLLEQELEKRGLKIPDDCNLKYIHHTGIVLPSPRKIMQYLGTDIVRKHIDDLAWVKLWEIEQAKHDRVIAPDARFANEREAVKNLKGKNLLVKRIGVESQGHISEDSKWPEHKYDAVVHNNVSLMQIQAEVVMWYTHIK